MAWIEPVTNRTSPSENFTYSDMNRICGNINYLIDRIGSGTAIYDTYTVSDIVTSTRWTELITIVNDFADSISESHVTSDTTYTNFNGIETILLHRYQIMPFYPSNTQYPKTNLYPR